MKVRDLLGVLAKARNHDDTMSVQRLQTLLLVAEAGQGGIEQSTIAQQGGMSRASVNKNLYSFAAITHHKDDKGRKEAGPGWISIDPDPQNLRIRICKLTPKGEKAVAAMLSNGA